MRGKWPVLLVICALSLSGCAGIPGIFVPKTDESAVEGPAAGKPLTAVESQQVDCRTRLAKVEGVRIDQGTRGVMITFHCDTLFERNVGRIAPYARGLDGLADVLKVHRETQVRVDAHTDCTGSEEENLVLSESRAEALKEALVVRGVDASRITARGWGESKPAASNATEAGRQTNRRISVTLLQP